MSRASKTGPEGEGWSIERRADAARGFSLLEWVGRRTPERPRRRSREADRRRREVVNLFNNVNLGNPDSEIGVPGNAIRTPAASTRRRSSTRIHSATCSSP
jgi:hypothetical protein